MHLFFTEKFKAKINNFVAPYPSLVCNFKNRTKIILQQEDWLFSNWCFLSYFLAIRHFSKSHCISHHHCHIKSKRFSSVHLIKISSKLFRISLLSVFTVKLIISKRFQGKNSFFARIEVYSVGKCFFLANDHFILSVTWSKLSNFI